MNWEQLISAKRFGLEQFHQEKEKIENRSEFQRDFDRLVFSAPFRRLQNKTQVFPLPGSVFVHNRLTHSLEVSCVGRSLGYGVSQGILRKHPELHDSYVPEIGSIVSAACLAHDLGNPPFGHFGEKAFSSYFLEGNGQSLKDRLTEAQWNDLIHFEGNANSFRLLTHQFKGRRQGGFVMTYPTLASIIKYPYSSMLAGAKGKFGFFTPEEDNLRRIAQELGMKKISDSPLRYARYPLVYLVEAADDICYQIMDIEDSFKLKILSLEETRQLLLGFHDKERQESMSKVLTSVVDHNEQVAYLRSAAIGKLTHECVEAFLKHEEEILEGTFEGSLIDHVQEEVQEAYKQCSKVAYERIYCARDVQDVEVAGFKIIGTLIDLMVQAVLYPERAYSKLLINRVSSQYEIRDKDLFTQLMAVLDYVSGMTDVFALDLYRKLNGNSLPAV